MCTMISSGGGWQLRTRSSVTANSSGRRHVGISTAILQFDMSSRITRSLCKFGVEGVTGPNICTESKILSSYVLTTCIICRRPLFTNLAHTFHTPKPSSTVGIEEQSILKQLLISPQTARKSLGGCLIPFSPGLESFNCRFVENRSPEMILRMNPFSQKIPWLRRINEMDQPPCRSNFSTNSTPVLADIGQAIESWIERK